MKRSKGAKGSAGTRSASPAQATASRDDEAEAARFERQTLAYAAEVHQIELEQQHRALAEARGELESSWARYAELYEHAPVAQLTFDGFGIIRQLNLACAALLGGERRLFTGQPLRGLLEPSSRPELDAHLRACVARREERTAQLVFLARGERRHVELVTAQRATSNGEALLCHSALIDVSERRRADERHEALLRRERDARLLAESANQIKEDFLAVVSHELRTPLASVLLWLKALRLSGAKEGLRARAVGAVETNVAVLAAMIDDLVDVSRGRHDKLRVERRPLDLRPVVSGAVEALAPSAAAKMISVDLSMPSEPACVSGDTVRLRQVASNLLSNAIKFTPEGGRVTVALANVDDQVKLVVGDSGEGLDADRLEGVFDPFWQKEGTKARRHGGLGLGLTIVRLLVEEHDGSVQADSAGRGKGASFTVKLPRIESLEVGDTAAAPSPSVALAPASGALAGVRILVVEDQPDTREALQVTLAACGGLVLTATSASEAWPLAFRAPRPDVVLSDIGLPDDDGYVFMRRLRAQELEAGEPRVAAIAVTAYATPRDRSRALLSGFDRHVSKPLVLEDLVAAIASLLRRRG